MICVVFTSFCSPVFISLTVIDSFSSSVGPMMIDFSLFFALALDINKDEDAKAIILTDDYSIQNVASTLNIKYQSFSQKGITKKFKWQYRCPGCKKQFKETVTICPICGTETRLSRTRKK